MDEIIEAFKNALNGNIDSRPYVYENISVIFMSGFVAVYNVEMAIPYGNYKLPGNEGLFVKFLESISEKIRKLEEENKYICYKCKREREFPEAKRDANGNLICGHCVSGESEDLKISKSEEETNVVTNVDHKRYPPEIVKAMKLLTKSGFVVKKSIKSYKVVYHNSEGKEVVSDNYYKNEEEFKKSCPNGKFLCFIKELHKLSEEELD